MHGAPLKSLPEQTLHSLTLFVVSPLTPFAGQKSNPGETQCNSYFVPHPLRRIWIEKDTTVQKHLLFEKSKLATSISSSLLPGNYTNFQSPFPPYSPSLFHYAFSLFQPIKFSSPFSHSANVSFSQFFLKEVVVASELSQSPSVLFTNLAASLFVAQLSLLIGKLNFHLYTEFPQSFWSISCLSCNIKYTQYVTTSFHSPPNNSSNPLSFLN